MEQPLHRRNIILVAAFSVVLLCMVGVVLIALGQNATVHKEWERGTAYREKVLAAFSMREAVLERSYRLTFTSTLDDFFDRDEQYQLFKGIATKFLAARAVLDKWGMTDEERHALAHAEETIRLAHPLVEAAMARIVDGVPPAEMRQEIKDATAGQTVVIDKLNSFVAVIERTAKAEGISLQNEIGASQQRLLVLSLGAGILALLIGLWILRREVQIMREIRQHQQQLEQMSTTDVLTSLANRRHMDDVLQNEINRCKRYGECLSVILADMDHFKAVNDTFGHLVGDRVLKDLAGILQDSCRDVDIVGRWGGEEFLIVCPGTTLAGAAATAEKLRTAIEDHEFKGVGHKTASFGVGTARGMESVDSLVHQADQALYAAKDQGRNRVELGGEIPEEDRRLRA
ncbi:GGDEF domain-containing protein [Magnetospira sp. QH-2]|uniref:GGDEF domain-containing protein n=1 Tax=Magnetospira sp. (strain QH-2) TaxID=1288970 RepID=UPI0003E81B74|nr:GGDEF domain-containing protein [Magnetospira sp. QH-2]CCQ74552.1 putative Diguanylate kinase containing a GGDEF domain [Magnetospira sp. QH-2]